MIEKLLGKELADRIEAFINNAPSASSSPEGTVFEKGNIKLFISTKDGLTIKYQYTATLEDKFNEYVKNIDDDIFVEAVEKHALRYGDNALSVLSEELKNPTETTRIKVENFKTIVKEVVVEHIDNLINKYGIV